MADLAESTDAALARQGPCGNPTCPAPDKQSGFWTYIPGGFSEAITLGATCTCRKADCLRYFNLKQEQKKPGRKRPLPAAAVEAPRRDDPCIPEQYVLAKIDEIWGFRCLLLPARARRP